MKTQQEYIEQGEQYILKTYNRFQVVLEKGKGVYLYDADQKKYLMVKGVGHYGIFNGRKWRDEIAPVVEKWIRAHGG